MVMDKSGQVFPCYCTTTTPTTTTTDTREPRRRGQRKHVHRAFLYISVPSFSLDTIQLYHRARGADSRKPDPFNWVRLTNAPTSLHYRSEGGLCPLILSTRPLGEIRCLFSESPESLLKKKKTFSVIWETNWLQLLTVFSVFLQFSFALARFIKEEKIKDLKVRKGSPNNVSQILATFTLPIIHLDPPP